MSKRLMKRLTIPIYLVSLLSHFSAMILEFASFMGPSYSMTNYFALFVLQVGIFLTFLLATVKGTVLFWVQIIRNSWHDNRISINLIRKIFYDVDVVKTV